MVGNQILGYLKVLLQNLSVFRHLILFVAGSIPMFRDSLSWLKIKLGSRIYDLYNSIYFKSKLNYINPFVFNKNLCFAHSIAEGAEENIVLTI